MDRDDLTAGTVEKVITSDLFQFPTTAARFEEVEEVDRQAGQSGGFFAIRVGRTRASSIGA